jgi:hypothetical protein
MKYKDRYAIKLPAVGYQEGYKSEEVLVDDNLLYTGRFFSCFICHTVTPFVKLSSDVHICSDECNIVHLQNEEENERHRKDMEYVTIAGACA